MAKKVLDLEEQSCETAARIWTTIPERYLKEPDPTDGLAVAWFRAAHLALESACALERLANLLRVKADIPEPGPLAELFDSPEQDLQPPAAPLAEATDKGTKPC